ncbi:MAG: family N-acetyltransferase [Brevundimonas sp.]|nr:family N-acetyltransferase [Brevundimonas sp.]
MSLPAVRPSTDADLEAITAIYAQNVLTGTGTFELTPPSLTEMTARRQAVLDLGLPWLVAEIDGVVVGYAYAAPFRTRAAYRYTVEDSIYVIGSAHGRGVGKALLQELVIQCETLGIRQMLGVIGDSANEASIRLHTACGFRHMGAIEGVGWKFDHWLDVIFMQRTLGHGAISDPNAPGLPLI